MIANLALRTAARRTFASSRNASTLILADHDNKALGASTLSAVTSAAKLGEITVLVAGNSSSSSVAEAASKVAGVSKVLHCNTVEYSSAESVTSAILAAHNTGKYSHILSASSNVGKNTLPRLSASLGSSAISEVIEVLGEKEFVRPMYAGNALAKVTNSDETTVLTIRATAFDKAAAEGGSASVESLEVEANATSSKFVSENVAQSDRPELTAAPVVVSGGRGLKNGENFKILETLADKLGGAVGASRAAVDAGYVPNELQVGQTGKVVAPDLYIAVGISGAIQHLSGMKDSKTIVCINKDKEAPIFQVSDYGLVEDLFTAVPDLTAKV